jgi:hypothetical protein
MCSSHLALGVPNWHANTMSQQVFLAPLPGIEEE